MKVAFIGLGKLGLPVAISLAMRYEVVGYDINPENLIKNRVYPHRELGLNLDDSFQDYFENSTLKYTFNLKKAVESASIIFIAVQTPHETKFEGISRLPEERADFNYEYLIQAVKDVQQYANKEQIIVIISTVLPGTMRREIMPLLDGIPLVYNPSFVAMGTVMRDFRNPEFVLMGSDSPDALAVVRDFYHKFYDKDFALTMSVESAELCKVAYNTFISCKIAFANTLMEFCHKTPNCNVDDITNALGSARDRLISPRYLNGGMGDGGPCHCRDNIAMSWLANKLNISGNFFDKVMHTREEQAEWLVDLLCQYDLPKVVLGKSYKPETNITTGSPALLCAAILKERNVPFSIYEPYLDEDVIPMILNNCKSVFLIATKHKCFANHDFPIGSVVLDPFRYIKQQKGVTVIPLGIGQ